MRTSIREFKDRLSEYIRLVQSGEEATITSRNRPVARLVPAAAVGTATQSREAFLAEPEELRKSLEGKVKGEPMSQTVLRRRARY